MIFIITTKLQKQNMFCCILERDVESGTRDHEPGATASIHQRVFISVSAVLRREIGFCDLEEAFFQGEHIEQLLVVEQPEEGIPADACAFIFKPETYVNPFYDSEWLTSKGAEGERRDL